MAESSCQPVTTPASVSGRLKNGHALKRSPAIVLCGARESVPWFGAKMDDGSSAPVVTV